ncbi:arrestin domain-containing protein 3 isoform X2 [Drosophila willistoni]|uniref:arrestin domain-containing protein 3 isoform X2 n=1 Tax=Drosophila willistoni TaxID=7260 RepID=UPI000C26D561|nr:arrestin domain-containing protein 3 isoform X2 [Drosophila willistoni]
MPIPVGLRKSQMIPPTGIRDMRIILQLKYIYWAPIILMISFYGLEVSIEPGIRTYNFACQIPIRCPSSFEGLHGHVRYEVIVKLIRPWKFDQTFRRRFTVLKLLDLNAESYLLKSPAHSESQKTFGCGICLSSPLDLRLSLPQRGYVPGQTIPVSVLATNESYIRVEEIKVSLVMMVIYYSNPPCVETTTQNYVVAKKKGEGVLRNSKKQFIFDLGVPPTPPTCFDLCRILQIAYQIVVVAKVKGCHVNGSVHMPVTIGSVPFRQELQQQQPRRIQPVDPIIPLVPQELDAKALVLLDKEEIDTTDTAPSPWASDLSINPPSYSEALHIPPNVKKSPKNSTNEEVEEPFTPLYPVFNISSPLASNGEQPTGYSNRGGFVDDDNIDRSSWL